MDQRPFDGDGRSLSEELDPPGEFVDRIESRADQMEITRRLDHSERPPLDRETSALRRETLEHVPFAGAPTARLGPNINAVYRAELVDGRSGFLKPGEEEYPDPRQGAIEPGTQWIREIAACDVDRALDLNVVPDTERRHLTGREWVDPQIHGNCSLQEEAPMDGRPYDQYSDLDRQSIAILDYLTANTDRHDENYMTQADGRPAAIDNGMSFPSTDEHAIRSQFVADYLDRNLDQSLVDQIRATDRTRLVERLRDRGIDEDAIAGFDSRFDELATHGRITGTAWNGSILDGSFSCNEVRASRRPQAGDAR